MGLYLNDEADGECRGGVAEVRPDVRPDFVVVPDGGGVRLVAVGIAQLALDLVRLLLPLDAQQEAVGAKFMTILLYHKSNGMPNRHFCCNAGFT